MSKQGDDIETGKHNSGYYGITDVHGNTVYRPSLRQLKELHEGILPDLSWAAFVEPAPKPTPEQERIAFWNLAWPTFTMDCINGRLIRLWLQYKRMTETVAFSTWAGEQLAADGHDLSDSTMNDRLTIGEKHGKVRDSSLSGQAVDEMRAAWLMTIPELIAQMRQTSYVKRMKLVRRVLGQEKEHPGEREQRLEALRLHAAFLRPEYREHLTELEYQDRLLAWVAERSTFLFEAAVYILEGTCNATRKHVA